MVTESKRDAAMEPKNTDAVKRDAEHAGEDHHTPGTLTLVGVLLVCFVIYYFANWKALADVWHVR